MATKAVDPRRENYSTLVARYARAIKTELEVCRQLQRGNGASAEIAGSTERAKAAESARAVSYVAIDTRSAEALDSGSLIFPEPEGGTPTWCIFSQSVHPCVPAFKALCLVGILQYRSTTAEFLEQAYRLVLKRPVDDAGLSSYLPRLEAGTLTRRSVLRSLAGSIEAGTKGIHLIIVPEAGDWLAESQA